MKRVSLFLLVFLIVQLVVTGFPFNFVPIVKATDVEFQIADSLSDAWQMRQAQTWSTDGTSIYIYSDSSPATVYDAGFTFVVTIPQGAIISSGILSLYAWSTTVDDINCDIYAEDADNAEAYGTGTTDLEDRTRTTETVSWSVDSLGIGWHNKIITDIVEEVTNRTGWNSGNNMSILCLGKTDTYKGFRTRAWDYGSLAAKLYVSYTIPEPPSGDDTGHTVTDVWSSTAIVHILGKYAITANKAALRFNASIPQGATIGSAYLKFYAANNQSGITVNVNIWADDVADSTQISSEADWNSRPKTTARVEWNNIPAWTEDVQYTSSNISTIVQEIVNNASWVSGNHIQFLISDNSSTNYAKRYFSTYDDSPSLAPQFEYTIDNPPLYQNVGQNDTVILPTESIKLYSQGYDDVALDWAWLATNETGSWKNYTEGGDLLGFWDTLVTDAKWGWQAGLDLRDDFNSVAGNLTCHYNSSSETGTDYLYPDLLASSLYMYLLTGNNTYLDYAKSTTDDIEQYMLENSTYIIGNYKNSTQSIDNDTGTSQNYRLLKDLAILAELDSNYISLMEKIAQGLINYHISANNLMYPTVFPNGTKDNVVQYFTQDVTRTFDGLLYAYGVNSNQTYLTTVGNIIAAIWDLRNTTTNLFPDQINADNLTVVEDFQRQYGCAAFIRALITYYYETGNETIKNMAINYTDGVYKYVWDGDHWDYRTNTDGSVNDETTEIMFAGLDWSMIVMTDLTGNISYRQRAFDSLDYDFFVDEFILDAVSNSKRAYHRVQDIGQVSGYESLFTGCFALIPLAGMRQYQHNNNDTYLTQMQLHYTGIIDGHNRSTYGYQMDVHCETGADVPFGGYLRMYGAPEFFGAWCFYMIQPSGNVNITWIEINNTDIYMPWSTMMYSDGGWFTKVHFYYDDAKIVLDEVSNSGNITFPFFIKSAEKDGVSYTNITGKTLNTVAGTHNYTVYWGKHYDSPMDMHDVKETWTWSNFTWSNSSVGSGKTVQWRIYYSDTHGSVNFTSIQSFLIGALENFFGIINQQFSINRESAWTFNRYAPISQQFTVNSQKTASFDWAGLFSQVFGGDGEFGVVLSWVFSRFASINTVVTISSFAEFISASILNFFGTIELLFAVVSQKSMGFNLYSLLNPMFAITSLFEGSAFLNFFGVINEILNVASQKTVAFNLFSTINPTFTVTSIADFVSSQILNFFGTIQQVFTLDLQKALSFSRYSMINPVFNIQGTFSSGTFLNLFGSIIQQFTVTMQKALTFNRYSTLTPIFGIDSIAQFTQPSILNFYGIINQVLNIAGWTDLTPTIAYATKGFVLATLFLIVLVLVPVIFIVWRRK